MCITYSVRSNGFCNDTPSPGSRYVDVKDVYPQLSLCCVFMFWCAHMFYKDFLWRNVLCVMSGQCIPNVAMPKYGVFCLTSRFHHGNRHKHTSNLHKPKCGMPKYVTDQTVMPIYGGKNEIKYSTSTKRHIHQLTHCYTGRQIGMLT